VNNRKVKIFFLVSVCLIMGKVTDEIIKEMFNEEAVIE
jgi:hypothetical protein